MAAQATSRLQGTLAFIEFFFGCAERGQVINVGFDLVFGKRAADAADLAAATQAAAAAD